MQYVPDRAKQQTDRFTSKVREIEDFVNLTQAVDGAKWQVLEDVYWDLLTKRHLGDAADAQLDVLGKHLITARRGLNDAEYEALLDTRYNFFQRSGEPERLIELFSNLTGAYSIRYDDNYKLQCNSLTAFFQSGDLADLLAVDQEAVIEDMRRAKQGGQGLRLMLALQPVFRYSAIPDQPTLASPYGYDNGKYGLVIIEF